MVIRPLGNGYHACECDGVQYATIEVFYVRTLIDNDTFTDGWYWWSCFPGCLPDGDAYGPFATEQEALDDAATE